MNRIEVTLPDSTKASVDIVRFFDAYGKKYLVFTKNEKDEQRFEKVYACKISGAAKALVGEYIEDDNEWSTVKGEFKRIIEENDRSGATNTNDINPTELENATIKGYRIIKISEDNVNKLSANQKQFEVETAPVENDFDFFGDAMMKKPEPQNYDQPEQNIPFQMPSFNFNTPAPVENHMEAPVEPSYTQPEQRVPFQMPTNNFGTVQNDFPTMPSKPENITNTNSTNYEEMYNELKEKLDRCVAELEKVTNENVELRIKLDDIREILNEN